MNKTVLKYYAIIVIGFTISCSSTSSTRVTSETGTVIENEEVGVYNSLGDYLRRVPGIQFTGGYYTVRGAQTFGQGISEPLYVVDGIIIGNSYEMANNTINPLDIERVVVLKDISSTNKYGMRGSSGVIEIITKKD
jgi:TonB-dependent SusC/RagA subfamily outer membrane receptor